MALVSLALPIPDVVLRQEKLFELASTVATWDRSWGAVTTVEHSPKGMVFNFDH